MSEFLLVISEDCTDCFGTQKKDESNDKEKKEEEETSTSVHHSIIETWDWGRQPGERATWARLRCVRQQNVPLLRRFPVFLLWLVLFYTSLFPSRVINTMLAADGFTTPKCRLDAAILSISTHGEPLCLSVSRLSGHAEVCMFSWHVRCGNSEMTTRLLKRLSGYFYHSECNIGRT